MDKEYVPCINLEGAPDKAKGGRITLTVPPEFGGATKSTELGIDDFLMVFAGFYQVVAELVGESAFPEVSEEDQRKIARHMVGRMFPRN